MPSQKKCYSVRLSPKAEEGLEAWLGGVKISERIERLILGSPINPIRIDRRILIEEARGIRAEIKKTGNMIAALLQAPTLTQHDRARLMELSQKILATAQEIKINPFWDER